MTCMHHNKEFKKVLVLCSYAPFYRIQGGVKFSVMHNFIEFKEILSLLMLCAIL